MSFSRIAVIGISASGKSTFARALAGRTGLPLFHGDQLEWLPNWGVRPNGELAVLHETWIAQPRWIIEGWIEPDRAARLNEADIVIDLDFPGWLCAWRVLARMLHAVRRPEMPDGCVDKFSWQTLGWVLRKSERPSIDGALRCATPKNYLRMRTPRAASNWLQSI